MAKKATKATETAKGTIPAELVPIVDRMRKAEAARAAAEKAEGRTLGREWASERGESWELERLEASPDVLAATPRDEMVKAFVSLLNGRPADWDDAREFFTDQLGEGRQDEWEAPGFVEAFAAGALSVWHEVKAHVNAA